MVKQESTRRERLSVYDISLYIIIYHVFLGYRIMGIT